MLLRLALRLCLPLTLIAALAVGVLTAAARSQPRSPWLTWVDPHGRVIVWDGALQTALTGPTDESVFSLSWSPDGHQLAWMEMIRYTSQWIRYELYIGGLEDTRLIADRIEPPFAWSPDGGLIFSAWNDGSYDLFRYADGGITPISQRPGHDLEPVIAPDGRIAWLSGETRDDHGLYVTDGITTRRVFAGAVESRSFSWSADGRLAWLSDHEDGTGQIFVWDGSASRAITPEADTFQPPIWSPQGRLAWGRRGMQGDAITIWDGENVRHLEGFPAIFIGWSSDERLAWLERALDFPFDVAIWDGQTIQHLSHTIGHVPLQSINAVRWQDDGSLTWFNEGAPTTQLVLWNGVSVTMTEIGPDFAFNLTPAPDGRLAWSTHRNLRARGSLTRVIVWDGAQMRDIAWDVQYPTPLVWSPGD